MSTKIFINGSEVLLDYAIPQRDILENQLKEFVALDGTRRYMRKNLHSYFTVLIYIWKYSNTQAGRRNKFLQFENYKYQTCYLQPDTWWGWIMDGAGSNVEFEITEVSSFPIYDPNSEFDVCIMRFRSTKPVEAEYTVLRRENYPDGTDGDPIYTDDDKQIILDI